MARPNITITEIDATTRLVRFEIPGGITSPEEFSAAVAEVEKELPSDKLTLLNGRGPVWGYAMLLHACHPTPACATFDPRLGYVVVASHNEAYVVGSAMPDPEKSAE